MAQITNIRLGAKFAGACAVCGVHTGSRSFELADTLLGRRGEKWVVMHPTCAGWKTKSAISGGRKGAGPTTISL